MKCDAYDLEKMALRSLSQVEFQQFLAASELTSVVAVRQQFKIVCGHEWLDLQRLFWQRHSLRVILLTAVGFFLILRDSSKRGRALRIWSARQENWIMGEPKSSKLSIIDPWLRSTLIEPFSFPVDR